MFGRVFVGLGVGFGFAVSFNQKEYYPKVGLYLIFYFLLFILD